MGTSPSPEIGLLQPKLTLYFYIWILALKRAENHIVYCNILYNMYSSTWLHLVMHVKFYVINLFVREIGKVQCK